MLFPGGKEQVRKIMARLGIKFKVKGSFVKELTDVVQSLFGKRVQKNFGRFRPVIEEAIDDGVINRRSEFIPDDNEAAELGIGQGGSIDRERTQGAWRQLLASASNGIVAFSVRKDSRRNKIGNITVNINEEAFFNAPLSNIDTESKHLPNIPWMEWLIEGSPNGAVLDDYAFSSDVPESSKSRTGAGRMIIVQGGLWTFGPARQGAFSLLGKEVERQIEIAIRRNIGKVL